MKLIVVKCPKNKKVQVEDRGTGGASCPQNCPLKMSSRCFNNTFRYTKPLSSLVTPDIPYVSDAHTATDAAPIKAVSGSVAQPKSLSSSVDTPVERPKLSPSSVDKAEIAAQSPKKSSTNAFDKPQAASASPVFEDIYSGDDDSTIEYSPFGSFVSEQPAAEYSQPAFSEPKRTIDKYNDALTANSNSIFSVVKQRSDSDPCFIDGAYKFYERAPKGVRSEGNSKTAMRYIFKHWYVSRVFTDDGNGYREEFLYLLKLCGFKSSEDKLKEIVDDTKLSKDKKFFRLFYTVIYKNQINSFYWSDGDSPFNQVTPRLVSVNDFYQKLSSAYDPSDFVYSFRNCFDELVYFLRSFSEMDNAMAWFKEKIPQIIAERCGRLVYVSNKNGEISINNLGNTQEFVANMTRLLDFDTLEIMCDFLKEFEITSKYGILPRKGELKKCTSSRGESDETYEILGITGYTSSQCATVYDNYLTVLGEYIRVFKPEKITIGDLSFSVRNFYYEILSVFKNAGAYLTDKNPEKYREVKIFYVVKSLFERGIFDTFEKSCETKKLAQLKEIFTSESVGIDDYFSCKDITHELYVDGYFISVSEYIGRKVNNDAAFILGSINDEVLNAYLAENVDEKNVRYVSAEREINRMLKEQKELIGKLKV